MEKVRRLVLCGHHAGDTSHDMMPFKISVVRVMASLSFVCIAFVLFNAESAISFCMIDASRYSGCTWRSLLASAEVLFANVLSVSVSACVV